jgi:hypothetical protein
VVGMVTLAEELLTKKGLSLKGFQVCVALMDACTCATGIQVACWGLAHPVATMHAAGAKQ